MERIKLLLNNIKSAKVFFKEFLKNPSAVASLVPSSSALAQRLVEFAGVSDANVIVEIGAGTGVVTNMVIKTKGDQSKFISLEISEPLAQTARKLCPEAEIVCADARLLKGILIGKGYDKCDSIVSCIPWATIPPSSQDELLEVIDGCLADRGRFATLILATGLNLPSTKRFERKLQNTFSRTGRSKIVWANMPPAVVLWGEK